MTKEEIQDYVLSDIELFGIYCLSSRKIYLNKDNKVQWSDIMNACKELILEKKIEWSVDFETKRYIFFNR